jgi:hypothetical protein
METGYVPVSNLASVESRNPLGIEELENRKW